MIWLLIFLWITAAVIVGFPVGLLALPKESRLSVHLAYAAAAGLCLQGLLLILLWGVVPLGTGVYVVLLLAFPSGAFLLWLLVQRHPFGQFTWGLSRSETLASLALVALYGLLGQRAFTVAYTAGDSEARYRHSGLVSWLSHGLYPPTNPLEPDDPLHYRFGLHALAAGISSASNSLPPEALAATIAALLPLIVLALVGASLRVFDRPGPGIVASILGLFGGTLFPYYSLVKAIGSNGSDLQVIDLVNGLLWHGNTLDMLHINPSIAVGFAVFTAALWLSWEAAHISYSKPIPFLTMCLGGLAALTYLGLVNEVYFSALASGLVATGVIESLVQLRAHKAHWSLSLVQGVILSAAAFGIVSFRGGLLGGVSLTSGNTGAINLTVNLDHFGSLVSPPRQPEIYWVPLLSSVGQLDTDFAFLILPLLVLAVWWTGRSYAMLGLMASGSVLVLWATIYPGYRPSDAYRFGQAALTIYLTILPFGLASLSRAQRLLSTRLGHLVTAVALAVLTLPHLVFGTWLLVAPPKPMFLQADSPDTLAAEYLRTSTTTYRVLVPDANPAGSWDDMYMNYGFHITAATMLALSGHAVPMGDQLGPFHPQAYVEKYRLASTTFDPTALAALKIDWVYVAPSYLDSEQLMYLHAAQQRGELKLDRTFGEPGTGTERLLFRFYPQPTAP